MASAATDVRAATGAEVPLAVDVLRRAGFHANVARLLEYPRCSPQAAVLLAHGTDGAVGVACCASFGATGWIGALGVVPEMRRRGLGTTLTEAASEWLRQRGARTVLLYATEQGRPVYERAGFEAEGHATAWRGIPGAAPAVALRALGTGDRDGVRAIDRAATGEDRDAVLRELRPLSGLAATAADGTLRGWALRSPWGAGASITANDPEAGVALMAAAARDAADALVVPDANEAGVEAVRRWRFAQLNGALRMRLGPPVAWKPERQFGLFNLFWG